MTTEHSISLAGMRETCCNKGAQGECRALTYPEEYCDSKGCKFYKPIGCSDWVRIDDIDGPILIPPEEYRNERAATLKRQADYMRLKIERRK